VYKTTSVDLTSVSASLLFSRFSGYTLKWEPLTLIYCPKILASCNWKLPTILCKLESTCVNYKGVISVPEIDLGEKIARNKI
jgi:hypothetical protein